MELRRVFGSDRDSVVAPQVFLNELPLMQVVTKKSDRQEPGQHKSNLKFLKQLSRSTKKELKYVGGTSRDSRVTPL